MIHSTSHAPPEPVCHGWVGAGGRAGERARARQPEERGRARVERRVESDGERE